jgi:hypothetical protein
MRAVECVSCSVETIRESLCRRAMLRRRVVILTRRAQSDPSPGHGIRNNRCMRRGHALASRCASDSVPRVYNSMALVVFCADARRSRPARSQPGVSRTMPNPLRERHASLCSCMPHGALVNSRARAPPKNPLPLPLPNLIPSPPPSLPRRSGFEGPADAGGAPGAPGPADDLWIVQQWKGLLSGVWLAVSRPGPLASLTVPLL